MTIDLQRQPQAQRAADLYYTLRGAVEDCGADPALTDLVIRLSDDHRRIRQMFGLDPSQIVKVIRADDIYPLCTHESSSGIDTDDGPDKVWQCDACGWRYRMVPDPESPGTEHPVAV